MSECCGVSGATKQNPPLASNSREAVNRQIDDKYDQYARNAGQTEGMRG